MRLDDALVILQTVWWRRHIAMLSPCDSMMHRAHITILSTCGAFYTSPMVHHAIIIVWFWPRHHAIIIRWSACYAITIHTFYMHIIILW